LSDKSKLQEDLAEELDSQEALIATHDKELTSKNLEMETLRSSHEEFERQKTKEITSLRAQIEDLRYYGKHEFAPESLLTVANSTHICINKTSPRPRQTKLRT